MDAGLPRLEFEAHGRIAPAVAKTRGNRASSGTKQQNPAFHPPFHQLSRVKSDRLLVPHWAKDPTIGAKLNNARGESVAEKPSFRDAFNRRRCLVPATGFFEWKTEGKIKQPHYISLRSGEPMAMGGLWESWKSPDGSILRTVCIVTVGPNAAMEPIHDRMPVILTPEHWQAWLTAPTEDIQSLVVPCPADLIQTWAVSRRVSKTAEDDASLIAPFADAMLNESSSTH
jgi:putative SOS response-associated peptidase YedK